MSNFLEILNYHKKSIFYSLLVYFVLFLILLSTGIKIKKQPETTEFIFDFSNYEESETSTEQNQKQENQINDKRLNIAVNKALKDDNSPLKNPYDFYDMDEQSDDYKEKLIKEALGDEYDDYANKEYKVDEKYYELIKKSKQENTSNEQKESNYQGATYVTYFLNNRHERNLFIPTYECEEQGVVEVQILVDRLGRVVKAEIKNANASAQCLIDAALRAARRSYFSPSNTAPEKQTGTITYTFEEQR